MKTFKDFELEIMRVREAINDMDIKGERNASLLVYAVGKCNDMIKAIHEIVNQNSQNQNKAEEVTSNGDEQDSGES